MRAGQNKCYWNRWLFLRSLASTIAFSKLKPQWQRKTQTPQSQKRVFRRKEEQGSRSPLSLLSEPISPSFLLFEPIYPSSLNVYLTFSPSSLLFPPISPSSQFFLGHFSLLPILFLPHRSVSSLRVVVERRFMFALCDVQLLLRHLRQIKLVSKKVDSFKVTRTMWLRINSCFETDPI